MSVTVLDLGQFVASAGDVRVAVAAAEVTGLGDGFAQRRAQPGMRLEVARGG
ncbi:hypothetical protein [Streptomyces sp. NPDC048825]|uniref:hypothetical protein n=1 Tax=Streptomyces sp. NPDC048825 TaxID=3365592 RepID=UPI003710B5BC